MGLFARLANLIVRWLGGPQPVQPRRPVHLLEAAAELVPAAYEAVKSATSKRAPTEEYTDLPITVLPAWSVKSIQTAYTAHNNGQFGMASLLAEAMLADDRIQSAVNGRIKAITKCTVTMQPALV